MNKKVQPSKPKDKQRGQHGKKSMSRRKQRGFNIFVVIAIVVVLSGGALFALWKPAPINEDERIFIPRDSTFDAVVDTVVAHRCVSSAALFRTVSRFVSYTEHVKSGSYLVTPNMGVIRLVYKLYRGNQDPVRLTIGNIRTIDQLCHSLGSQLEFSADTMRRLLGDDSLCAAFDLTPQSIISLFMQNSYEVYWNIRPNQLLQRMETEYDRYWNEGRLRQCVALKLSPAEVTTLASIVEEETRQDDEKELIASVYLNRLRRGMPLQADPTVKFATGNFALRRITASALKTESPYNTYTRRGLPPGPICIPGRASLEAVLANRQSNYIYFCASDDFSGHHRFAATLAEHNENARRYHRALDARGIK